MPQVHLYLAAMVCILVQIVACGQKCSNARQQPLSFTVVNKRNATCHWVPEVQMDAGADNPLLNGGWHVRISLPKVKTQGYGQVVEVIATKKFNEFTAPAGELCGATTASSILTLINEKQDSSTVPFAVTTTSTSASPRKDGIQTSPTEVSASTTVLKSDITSLTFKDSNTHETTTEAFASSSDPDLIAASSVTSFPSSKKTDVLFTTQTTIPKHSLSTSTKSIDISTTTNVTDAALTKPFTSVSEQVSSKKPDNFTRQPTVSTPTEASPSTTPAALPKTSTKDTKESSKTLSTTTPRVTLETLIAQSKEPETPTPSMTSSTTKASIPVAISPKVTVPTKDKDKSTVKPTVAEPDIDEKDKDKVDDFDLEEDLDIDERWGGEKDNEDKEEDYAIDYSLNLNVKPE